MQDDSTGKPTDATSDATSGQPTADADEHAREPAATQAPSSEEPSMRTAAAKARGAAEDVTIVMTSRVKDLLQQLDMRVDSDLVHAVNQRVQDMLTEAAERAKRNQRKTVRPHDL